MLIFTYSNDASLGCIDLAKVKHIYLEEVDYDDNSVRIVFDDIEKWFNLGSIITSFDENGEEAPITLKKLLEFEKQVIVPYDYESALPQLIIRYCILNPKCSFLTS